MSELHAVYLNLGSNIDPEFNLPKAIQLLRAYGQVTAVSQAWESESVGFHGPNFLNACLLFHSDLQPTELKENIIRAIEAKLGRKRNAEKNSPRTIDIDIVLFNQQPLNIEYWSYAFVAVPLAELIPDFIHPISGETLSVFAKQLRTQVWIIARADVTIF